MAQRFTAAIDGAIDAGLQPLRLGAVDDLGVFESRIRNKAFIRTVNRCATQNQKHRREANLMKVVRCGFRLRDAQRRNFFRANMNHVVLVLQYPFDHQEAFGDQQDSVLL